MSEYLTKLRRIKRTLNLAPLNRQVETVEQVITAVKDKKVLHSAPAHLSFNSAQMELLATDLDLDQRQMLYTANKLLNSLRQFLSIRFGIWSLPNMSTANLIKQEFGSKRMLEVMAGNAYWSLAFSRTGVVCRATDSLEWARSSQTGQRRFYPVTCLDAATAISRFKQADIIFCCWAPNFGREDVKAVEAWRKYNAHAKFLFVGEKNGVTNSAAFWRQKFVRSSGLDRINASFRSFDFINEKIFEVKR